VNASDRNPTRDASRPEFPQPFGRYMILGRLGTGGMADALLAMLQGSMGFQKPVVLKRMHASLGRDSHFVKMFLDEARLAARLGHANVVATSEVGECDGHYFIAMDYLEGVSLDRVARKYIHEGREVPLGLLLRVLCDCLEGLHYAHELPDFDGSPLGVVHRDVTPSNLFVTSIGVAKVLDFGIAKASTQDEATRTGMLKGKLAYMSPEQFYDAPIDRRSDVWAMGVVVWEMVTGRRLFKGANDAQTYRNIMGAEVPPVATYRPDAPPELDVVIAHATARDRNQRYASADEMRVGLEYVLRTRLGNTSHAEVAAEIRARFADTLEDNRRAIREFTHGRPPVVPSVADDDEDEHPTRVNARDAEAVRALIPSAMAPAPKPTPVAPQPQGESTLDDPWAPEDAGDSSTVVDVKLPESLAIAAASVAIHPVTMSAPRAAPAAPVVSLAPLPAPPQSMPVAPVFDPIPADVVAPQPPRRAGNLAVQALGWLTLFALLAGVAAAAWWQRAFIERGARELVSGAPPDPSRVGTFQLRIVSVPSGAQVLEGGRDLGPTPMELTVLRGSVADQPRTFTFQLAGYAPASAALGTTAEARAEMRVVLVPLTPRR
jgi:serine/threonine protein kinase